MWVSTQNDKPYISVSVWRNAKCDFGKTVELYSEQRSSTSMTKAESMLHSAEWGTCIEGSWPLLTLRNRGSSPGVLAGWGNPNPRVTQAVLNVPTAPGVKYSGSQNFKAVVFSCFDFFFFLISFCFYKVIFPACPQELRETEENLACTQCPWCLLDTWCASTRLLQITLQ